MKSKLHRVVVIPGMGSKYDDGTPVGTPGYAAKCIKRRWRRPLLRASQRAREQSRRIVSEGLRGDREGLRRVASRPPATLGRGRHRITRHRRRLQVYLRDWERRPQRLNPPAPTPTPTGRPKYRRHKRADIDPVADARLVADWNPAE